MENFIVSARKYRPATFDTVVGQSHITNTLKNAIKNNHLAQAFLFCGPRGVGKTTCARILAKTINCTNPTESMEACDQCESCVSFRNGTSLNIHELDAASNNSVDDIRNLVEQVRFAPPSGKYKIYIIDEVHMLSPSAFNAFLKTLEEPPSYAIFILATTEKHKIIPTILSRCQIFDFNRIQVEDIAEHLAYISKNENIIAEPEALHIIAQKADGALRDALSIYDQNVSFAGQQLTYQSVIDNLNILDYDYYFKITDAILNESVKDVLLIFDEILRKGFDGNNCIVGLSEHLRNLLVCKDAATVKLLKVSNQIKDRYLEQSQKISSSVLLTALQIANQCDIHYKTSKNQRLHVELAFIKMCHIPSAISLAQLPADAQAVKKKMTNEPVVEEKKTISQNTPVEKPVEEIPKTSIETAVQSTLKPSSGIKKSSTLKLPSLADIKSGNYQIQKEEAKETEPENLPNNQFDEFDFNQAWAKCVEIIASKNQHSLNAMISAAKPVLDCENFKATITFNNKIQHDLFLSEKPHFIGVLREKIQNYSFDFVLEINTDKEDLVPYTNADKFKVMSTKNPALLKLKESFNLDIN